MKNTITSTETEAQAIAEAQALIEQNKLNQACEILNKLVMADTPLSEPYYLLGCLRVQKAELSTAIDLFKMALERDPSSIVCQHNLAFVYAALHNYENALEVLSPLLRSHRAGPSEYKLLREILGASPELSAISWARLIADLRSIPNEYCEAIEERPLLYKKIQFLEDQITELESHNQRQLEHLYALAAQRPSDEVQSEWANVRHHSDSEWLTALTQSPTSPNWQNVLLPQFPAEDVQIRTNGSSYAQAIMDAFPFYLTVKQQCAQFGISLDHSTKILDFGSGWGRISRLFLKDVGPNNLYGVDVDSAMIDRCRSLFPYGTFDTTPALPPTHLPPSHFHLITAYSVFSHLAENAACAWIEEFSRILAPGGVIVVTTQKRSFIDYCEQLRTTGERSHVWHYSLARAFVDVEGCREAYDKGEFLYEASGGGPALPSSFYGEALVPPLYVERVWSRYLEPVAFLSDECYPQAIIVMRKKNHN